MKLAYLLGAAALATVATSANAAVTLTAANGADPYAGLPVTYDFDTTIPTYLGGSVVTGSVEGQYAQPVGSTGDYYAVRTIDTPGFIDLSSFDGIASLSFIWGSIDPYNTLSVIGKDSTVLGTWTGTDVVAWAAGNQVDLDQNPLVTLTFTGVDQGNVGGLEFVTTQNAFEIDNIAIQAVPEPGTWLMMLLGFGLLGGVMRAGKKQEARIRYAF